MNGRPCLCCVCPHCRSTRNVNSAYRYKGALGKLWWGSCACSKCGSRWAVWHWLEQRSGISWRRIYALAPGNWTPVELAELVRMQRQYARMEEVAR